MKAFILLLACATGLFSIQDKVKVGSLTFTPPEGWKATAQSGPRAAILSPDNLPTGKMCKVTVYPDETDKDGFRPWFNRKWTSTAMTGRHMLRMSEMAGQKIGGVDTFLRSGAYKDGDGEAYILLIGIAVEGRFVCVVYEANDYPLMERNQDAVYDMFDSFDLDLTGAPGTPTTPPSQPAVGGANPTKPDPASPKKTDAATPKKQNPGKPVQDASPNRLERLSQIAKSLQDPKSDAVALVTEAAQLCGFAIWKEDRTKVADPTGSPPLHLAVTSTEIKEYTTMFRAGHSVALADLAASIDVLYKGMGASDSSAVHISRWLETGFLSNNPSVRALSAWLQDLGSYRPANAGSGLANGFDKLDPIQALFVLRVVTEEVGVPVRKAIHKSDPYNLLVSLQPEFQGAEAPGWAGDAFAGGITGLWDAIISLLDAGESTVGKINKHAGRANAILSIIKFIATYSFLKGELRVETPGQPLVRTKDRDAGEVRTLVAKFYIDGKAVTDWMKDHRELVALAGLDLDMPKTGALKSVETEWEVRQSPLAAQKLIQTVRGGPNLYKVKTDDNGEAKVAWEGAPQPKDLDPKKVMPVMKSVLIIVTPQVKEVEMKQDLLDAVLSAIGIRGGPTAFIQPLMETLYRMKWHGAISTNLRIRDWKEAETIGQFKIEIQATARSYDQGSFSTSTRDRLLEFTDVGMAVSGGEAPPATIDPRVLQGLNETQRKQVEAGMKQMAELAKRRQFNGNLPGRAVMKIKDQDFSSSETCTVVETSTDSWLGNFDKEFSARGGDMGFIVVVDLEKKTATVNGDAALRVMHVHTSKDGKEPTETTRNEISMGVFSGLKLKAPFDSKSGGVIIPLKETPVIDMPGISNYYGAETVPFTWGADFKGNAILSYSVTRKVKPKGPGGDHVEVQQLNQKLNVLANFLNSQDTSPQMTQRTEAQELAMCYPTSVVLRGQLKHAKPPRK